MSDKYFYQKIGELELKDLVSFIDHSQSEIVIKINNQFVKTNVTHIKNEKHFSVFKFHSFDFSNEPITCCFYSKDEIYFFNSHLSNSNVDYMIDLPQEIYQLQRRNDFRVTMPMGLLHSCTINYVNNVQKNIKCELRDLSLGGCQISAFASESDIKAEDDITMYLKFDRFEFTKLSLKARHCKFIKENGNVLIGASFIDLDGETQGELRAMIMYLDRKSRGKES